MPAPKSLVSSTAATEVAAVNPNINAVNPNINSEARATLTSLTKPIEAAMTPVSTSRRAAELGLTPDNQSMRVGESRRFALDLKSDVPLSLAIIALRFDPKVVKVRAVSAASESGGASFTQSTDASGVCLISISNLNGMTGPGTVLFIDVEGIGIRRCRTVLDNGVDAFGGHGRAECVR